MLLAIRDNGCGEDGQYKEEAYNDEVGEINEVGEVA